jgi:predicted Rossmann fold flavoprotein
VVPIPPHARTDDAIDIVVVGAGAAGLMAAIFAAGDDPRSAQSSPRAAPARAERGEQLPHVQRAAAAVAEGNRRQNRCSPRAAPPRAERGEQLPHAQGAAAAVAEGNCRQMQIVVLERTRDGGRKILISGGGRCNVLPSVLAPERFTTDSSPNTLRNLLRSWPLDRQRAFFEREVGVALKLEPETGKLFPVSDRARDVRDGLVALARARGVQLRFGAGVTDLIAERDESGAEPRWIVTLGDSDQLRARAVVLATGGLSVPTTGSDGAGLDIARRLGHAVHATYPALTPLLADPPVHAALSGLSLDVGIRAPGSSRRTEVRGGFLFTHRGYSGPSVLDVSHLAVRARLRGDRQPLLVQWTAHDDGAWHDALRAGEGLVVSRLRERLPQRLADRLVVEADVPLDRTIATLRREERLALVERLCRYELPWSGDEGYRKAEVTGGGVALDEVDPRTLESRRQPGLFVCGEILDAFGPIGGHNFAWAWATGRLAGIGARRRAARPSP